MPARPSLHHNDAPAPGDSRDETAAVVLRAAETALGREEGAPFLLRRGRAALAGLDDRGLRSSLANLLDACDSPTPDGEATVGALLALAGRLESRGRLDVAADAVRLARGVAPGARPELALHAGRIARKRGLTADARAAYEAVRTTASPESTLEGMARIGTALLDPDPVASLTAVVRGALRAGRREVAAVATEERARARRTAGDRSGACSDYLAAAERYADPVDRARVAHGLADLLGTAGDLLGAREALLLGLHLGRPEQRAHVRSRLYQVSRALGDDLGRRRWTPREGANLVSLLPPRRAGATGGGVSAAGRVARWRERVLAGSSIPCPG